MILNSTNHRYHVGFCPFKYASKLAPPGFQGLAFLQVIAVPVIYTRHTAFDMVKDL
jgi:hypothetical protein